MNTTKKSKLKLIYTVTFFLICVSACESNEDDLDTSYPDEEYMVELVDGTVVDKRTSLFPVEEETDYSYKRETYYYLVPFADEQFVQKMGPVVALKRYVSELFPSYSQKSFIPGDIINAIVVFQGLKADGSGKTAVTGSMKITDPENKVIYQTELLNLHQGAPPKKGEFAVSASFVSFQTPPNLKAGSYIIHFNIHDAVHGIEVPLKASINIADQEALKIQRMATSWSAGWENEGKPFQLFLHNDPKVIDYLSNKLPRSEFYAYATKTHLRSLKPGDNLYAAIALTNPVVNTFADCNITVSFFLYDPRGTEIMQLRNGQLCDGGNYSEAETSLGKQRFAVSFPPESGPGDYLVTAKISEVATGKKFELGQKFTLK